MQDSADGYPLIGVSVMVEGKKIKSVSITCTGDKTGPISVGGKEYSATNNVIAWEGETEVFDANCVKQPRISAVAIEVQ